ncbi:hypothetical protein O6H91_03G110000 [Diphasiastrum complanatum]|uniref:Uncharacterized protein n=1 Tax=Diphasiastrum complanatum TaxID=34168 RepID=A0ACC2EAJ8_DIPCM|nr:hypothetical protein O6H91_03G110000 [Diphasiastrum complanatum]
MAFVWGGINLRTAENLNFAGPAQLLHDYHCCLHSKVSAPTVLAWLQHSYEGESTPDGMPHGQGKAHLFGDLSYTGCFKKGLLHGFGTIHLGNAAAYEGTFWCNGINGSGTYQWSGGARYVGEGKLVYADKAEAIYDGGWSYDRKHGEGHLAHVSGSTYRGSWFEGKRQGFGRISLLASPKLDQYDPQEHTPIPKYGRLDQAPIYIYEGDWADNLPHGRGRSSWTFNDSTEDKSILLNSYLGEFDRGVRHGHGTFFYASGAIFKGEWEKDLKEGPGVLIYEDGRMHAGIFHANHYKVTPGSNLFMKEPLDLILELEDNISTMKQKIGDLLLRYNAILIRIFTLYSSNGLKESETTFLWRSRAMFFEQLWRLCHDARIVEPGFGLAQIDVLLRSTSNSWDCFSDVHSPKRQLLFREFFESLVKLAKHKCKSNMSLEEKVDAFLKVYLLPLMATPFRESDYGLLESKLVQDVYHEYQLELDIFFYQTLRETGTTDGTVKISSLVQFFRRYKQLVALQNELCKNLSCALYYTEFKEGEDDTDFVHLDLNYKEFQLSLLKIAIVVSSLA